MYTISARLASTGSKIPPKVKNVSRISPQKKVHIPVVFWGAAHWEIEPLLFLVLLLRNNSPPCRRMEGVAGWRGGVWVGWLAGWLDGWLAGWLAEG